MNGWMDVGAESGVVQVPTAVSYMENGIFFCLDMICLAFFFRIPLLASLSPQPPNPHTHLSPPLFSEPPTRLPPQTYIA